VRARRRAADHDPDALQVRVEAALRRHHRVAPVLAEPRLLPADGADLRHAAGKCSYCLAAVVRSWAKASAISSAERAAHAPRSIRASACSAVSQVRTPNETGTPVSIP